jgi:NAD(P)-dependent dehydrogenase (short-subunit alcohol dehydrogenase family)
MVTHLYVRACVRACVQADMARPGSAAYAASKAAVRQFTKVLATELGPAGITCNVIQPGAMDTIGQRRAGLITTPRGAPPPFDVPAGRFGSVEDVGNAAVFLASSEASYINGSVCACVCLGRLGARPSSDGPGDGWRCCCCCCCCRCW